MDFHHSFYSNLYYKLVFVTLKQIEYLDDVGFFFEDISKRDFYSVDNIKEVFNFSKQKDGKFLDFAINFGSSKDTVRRNYKRIQSVIAEIGGLYKGIILTAILLKLIFLRNDVYDHLDYFIEPNKDDSNKNIISKNIYSKKSVSKLNVKIEKHRKISDNHKHNLSENNNINSENVSVVNNNNNNNNNISNNNEMNKNEMNKNLDNLYSNWKQSGNFKLSEKMDKLPMKNSNPLNAEELLEYNRLMTTKKHEEISPDLTFIIKNYLDIKEFLKTVIDLNLMKSILFDRVQYVKFEEMSRDMTFVLGILQEKEMILYDVIEHKD